MKLTTCMILAACLHVCASGFSQKVSLTVKNASIHQVLAEVTRQTGVSFVYKNALVRGEGALTFTATNVSIQEILNICFHSRSLDYAIEDGAIVIRPKPAPTLKVQAPEIRGRTITGTVKDEEGKPVASASVFLKGSGQTAVTNESGEFSITVPDEKYTVLVISCIGYSTREVKLGGLSVINIRIEKSLGELGGVVVTALGVKRSPRSIGYSAQKIEGKDLTIAQAPTIAQGLMGKVAGLNISQASGGVEGGSSRLVIRGNTSLTGDNRALIVVDGVPINNDPLNQNTNNSNAGGNLGLSTGADVSNYNDWGSGLNFINQEDIESVTVLKGPAAAALYGNRGANGVILVTRKKGSKRKGLGVDYSFNTRQTSIYGNFYNFQNEYGSGFAASIATADNDKKFPLTATGQRFIPQNYGPDNPGNYTAGAQGYLPYDNSVLSYTLFGYPSGLAWGPKFDNKPILWYDGVERPYSPKPNSWKSFYPNGYTNQHNVSVSGGGDFGTVRLSYTREDNKANILNSNYQSNVFNLGSSIKVSSKLTADVTASYVNYTRLNAPSVGGDGPLMGLIYTATPDYRFDVDRANQFNPDGSRRDLTNTSNFPAGAPPYPWNGGYMANYLWEAYKNNTVFNHNDLTGTIKLTADLTGWLTLTGQGGLDNGSDGTEIRNYPTDAQGISNGVYKQAMGRNKTSDLLGMFRIHKENVANREINLSFTGSAESYSVNNYTTTSSTNGNFVNPFLFNISNGVNPVSASDQRYAYKINSLIGFFDISYRNYLFLQVTDRKDWTSTLRPEYNSFSYPSASLSYVFSDGIKGFNAIAPWLSFGKLSLSYAQTGSGAAPYATNAILDGVAYNGVVAQSYQNIVSDPRIKPQRNRQYQAALNLGFFNNRLNAELTAYSGNASPQIVTNPAPISSGVNSIRINDAKLANKGFEFIINAMPVSTRDFSWSITINGAHSSNKLISLSGVDSVLTLGSYYGANGISQRVKVGDNYGTIYGTDYVKDPKSGQRVVKLATDGTNPLAYTVGGKTYNATIWETTPNEVPIGNSQPTLTGGIANTFRYKSFSLYFLTDAKIGGDTYFGSYGALMGDGARKETLKERDGGGMAYTYPDGTTSNSGMIMKGVFADGTPNKVVVPAPWYYMASYSSWDNVPLPRSNAVFKNSWMKLRELNVSWQIPPSIIAKTRFFQSLSLSLVGRDLFYLFTTIPKGLNPEGVNGIGNMQGIEFSSMPNTRSFGFSVKASF